MRLNRSWRQRILPVLLCVCGICQDLSGQAATTGMGPDGSTGLFLNPSPQSLSTGHMRIGLFSASNMNQRSKIGNLPLAFSLGFSERLEITGSLTAWPYSLASDDQLLSLGTKINILDYEGLGLSLDSRWQDWERAINDTGRLEETVLAGRLIGAFPVRRAVIHANLGYAQRESSSQIVKMMEYPAGVGVVRSFSDQLQTMAEYQTDNIADPIQSARWCLGVKWYLLDHLQLAAGVLGMLQYERRSTGIFFNLTFSTASLKAFFRRISSWELITLPGLEELDGDEIEMASEAGLNVPLPASETVVPVLDPEFATLPIPPPLENMDTWKPDEFWYERFSSFADRTAELPSPPSLDETESGSPTDSRIGSSEDSIMPESPGNEDLPLPPSLESFDDFNHQ